MNRLKELREEHSWSMRDAAKYLKKPYTTYVNHEKGLRGLDSEDLKYYASAYGVSVDYLVGRTDKKTPVTDYDDGLDNESIQLLQAFKSLSKEQQRMIIAQLQGLTQFQKDQDD